MSEVAQAGDKGSHAHSFIEKMFGAGITFFVVVTSRSVVSAAELCSDLFSGQDCQLSHLLHRLLILQLVVPYFLQADTTP